MKTLTNHTNEETARIVENYPYSWNTRTQIRYWIDTTKHGQRFMSQTLNPKTGNWNKPKAGTYTPIKVLIETDDGRISARALRYNQEEEAIAQFETQHAAALDERARKIIKHLRAHNAAMSKITWTIEAAQPGKVYQTREEQSAIINALTRVELAKQ